MIRESIVTTVGPDGTPHIAPIGVIVKSAGLVIAPFRPSATLDNLIARRQGVVDLHGRRADLCRLHQWEET